MTYDQIVELSGIAGLIFFIAIFVIVLIYAFRPSAKAKFERYGRIPFKGNDR